MVAKVADLHGAGSVKRGEKTTNTQFAKGGDTAMFGQQQAEPMKAGQTGDPGKTGKGAEFAKGGNGKMFGFSGALPARDGITSAR
jgi:hypothetical protein